MDPHGLSQQADGATAGVNPAGNSFHLIVVGGGAAGLAATIFAARRGASVLLIEHADQLGGSLLVSTGQLSAAGTRLQRLRGIEDDAHSHFEDVMRISRGTANPTLVRLAVDHAAETFDWLMEEGFQTLPEHPVLGFGHEPYRIPRYYWGAEGGLSIRKVLVPLVEALDRAGAIEVRLRHEAIALEVGGDGGVTGVRVKGPHGREQCVSADAVLLACGGYAANPEMFEQLNGYPQYNAAPYPWGRGAGLKLGESVGGYARGAENIFVNFGTLFDSEDYPAKAVGRIEHFPERRPPWEIYVNEEGHRFVREDVPSVDAREMALYMQPNYRYWIVFDEAIFSEAPPIIVDWTRDQLREAFGRPSLTFACDARLAGLAAKAGINAAGLARAVAGYNYGVATRNDFFGRAHMPQPIARAPFYAIRMQASAVSSSIGLAVDDHLRVVRRDGSAVPNLFAAGEILGSGQTMGKATCGGMMVTPALTFGRLLGQSLIPLHGSS